MNLLVGVNGAGKSTVLDVLRVMLSQSLPRFTASRSRPIPFEESDITVGQGALTAELSFEAAGIAFNHLMHIPREEYVIDKSGQGQVREQTYDLVERNELTPDSVDIDEPTKKYDEQPIAVYFSTGRSAPTMRKPRRPGGTGGQAAAFTDALSHLRALHLRELADWWLVQEALADEAVASARRLNVLNNTVISFLDDCANLRAVRGPETTLLIDKDDITLDVRQLSDGERSMIGLVFDLAWRLFQANPKLDHPLQDGKAVVLIDELDLHLHPSWQRKVVERLTTTFPNCQFIATTHSPQIIGEVRPDGLIFLNKETDRIQVHPGKQGYGLDTNWILEHLMDTPSRNIGTEQQIDQVENALEEGDLDTARLRLDILRQMLSGADGEVVRLEASINALEALADEVD
jgi:predicted ATP-binding protein involved in virulence